jgi:threonine synthase
MDIQVPSNLERFTGDPTREFQAGWLDDAGIANTIAEVERAHGYILDPHTATAWSAGEMTRSELPQLVVATAHPAKFSDSISPPDWFPSLQGLPEREVTIDPETSELEPLIR